MVGIGVCVVFLISITLLLALPCSSFRSSNGRSNVAIVGPRLRNLHQSLRSTPLTAIDYLDQSQQESVRMVCDSLLSLKSRPDLSWTDDGYTIAGCNARLDGFEAPGSFGNIAWMASLYISSKVSSLTVFNGPLTNVPHLVSRCYVLNPNEIALSLDFLPRAYGAYEKRDSMGNYPGPEEIGRVAFEYSGNRMEYNNKFGTPHIVNFFQSALNSFQGCAPNNRLRSELDLLTQGPLAINVVMPLTDSNVAAIAAARARAVEVWHGWATSRAYDHRPGSPINAQYVYDTKFKQNSFGALRQLYSELFGDSDGLLISSSESGPLDEAYVGGAS